MIKEAYVNFETAKLLKEKGFDEITFTWYNGKGKFFFGKNNYDDYHMNRFSNMESEVDKNKCSAPTQQMAMKWLREVHSLFICIEIGVGAYVWSITDISNNNVILKLDAVADSYEETVEAALKYSLENLI